MHHQQPHDEVMSQWVVCWSPDDYPGKFTVRRHVIGRGWHKPTDDGYVSSNIEWIRRLMLHMGLACMPRQPEDIPCIVEVWL